jgi:foldase protein PrsA
LRQLYLLGPVTIVLVAAFTGCSTLAPPAATVNGFVITDPAVAHQEKVFRFIALADRSPNPAACGATPIGPETAAAACARFTLQNLIQQHEVDIYAAQHAISVSDQELQQAVGTVTSQPNSQLDQLLASAGLTRADLPEVIRQLLLIRDVERSLVLSTVPISQLKQSYQQNILQFTMLHAQHILVKTRAEAENVYAQVTRKGSTEQDFLNLAKKVSIDPTAAQNSGDLGTVPATQLDQTFVTAALALKPGHISRPVQTQFGWHVIRLVSKQVTPFSQAEGSVAAGFGSQAFDPWIRGQLQRATVTVNPKYGRFDKATASVQPISSTSTGTPSSPTPAGPPPSP